MSADKGSEPQNGMREATLCFLVQGEPVAQVLMGFKKAGFGQGKITGFGGKVEPEESVAQAARREMEEESGVRVALDQLEEAGVLTFVFPQKPDWSQKVTVFLARIWAGEPAESDEMAPAWYEADRLPLASMWQDGAYWLPPILEGKQVQARFIFQADNESILEAEISSGKSAWGKRVENR
jgi:8-oxo-dGTP diphosphatase